MRGDSRMYLENSVRIPLVHLETLDGHGESQVFSFAHVRGPTVVAYSSNAYEFLLKNIRRGYDPLGFADLGKKS